MTKGLFSLEYNREKTFLYRIKALCIFFSIGLTNYKRCGMKNYVINIYLRGIKI